MGPDPAGAPAPAASSHSLPSSAPSTTRRGILPNRCHEPSRGPRGPARIPARTGRDTQESPSRYATSTGSTSWQSATARTGQTVRKSARGVLREESGPNPLRRLTLSARPRAARADSRLGRPRKRRSNPRRTTGAHKRKKPEGLSQGNPRAPEPDGLQPGKGSRATEPGPGAGATACSAPRNRG